MRDSIEQLKASAMSKGDISAISTGLTEVQADLADCVRKSALEQIRSELAELRETSHRSRQPVFIHEKSNNPTIDTIPLAKNTETEGEEDTSRISRGSGSDRSDLEAQSARSLPQLQDFESLPAIAAVTPRGKASHTVMFGDGPMSSRQPQRKRELIDEPGKLPRRVPTAAKVQIPGEGHSSSRLH
jgi:hypothetical protein